MNKNVGSMDRTLRIVLGVVIIAIGVYYQNWWGAVGIVPLFTAMLGWCPPYALFGINTCGVKQQSN